MTDTGGFNLVSGVGATSLGGGGGGGGDSMVRMRWGGAVADPRAIADFVRRDPQVLRFMLRAGDIVKEGAQRRVGVYQPPPEGPRRDRRPGTLRDSIVKRVVPDGARGIKVVVGSDDKVALWHHEGTVPHVIRPVRAKMLAFYSYREGRVVFRSQVNHPGTQPNRFLTDSLADLRRLF